MTALVAELREVHVQIRAVLQVADAPGVAETIARMEASAKAIGKAWSGSWLGYHSRVYYRNLQPPPPGANFSSEWGFIEFSRGSTGDWEEYVFDKVKDVILQRAGKPDLRQAEEVAKNAAALFEDSREQVLSVLENHSRSPARSVLGTPSRRVEQREDL